VQESGRAGRDGKTSDALLFTNEGSIAETVQRFENGSPTLPFLKTVYDSLNQYFSIALGDLPEESFRFDIAQFASRYELPLLKTYNAISVLSREGILIVHDNYSRRSTVQLIIAHHLIYDYMDRHPGTDKLLHLLLRTYGGIFDQPVTINEFGLAGKLGLLKDKLITLLKQLEQDGILIYNDGNENTTLSFLLPREDAITINRIAKNVKRQEAHKWDKLQAVIAFVQTKNICRNILISKYFGDTKKKKCGHCDHCLKKEGATVDFKQVVQEILVLLKDGPKSSNELAAKLEIDDESLIISLKILLEKNKIAITSQHLYKLNS
jgi:ATP-dependent DNA helicase RecQ